MGKTVSYGKSKKSGDKKMTGKRIGFSSPYLNIMGGGERYLLSIAEYFSQNNDVTLFAKRSITEKVKKILNISLKNITDFIECDFKKINFFEKYRILREFDLFFCMTDGSLFFPFSRKNFLIIQSP